MLQREIGPISSFVNNKSISYYHAEKGKSSEESLQKAGCRLPLQIKVMSLIIVTKIERDTDEDKQDVKSNNGMIISASNLITPKNMCTTINFLTMCAVQLHHRQAFTL